MDIKRLMDAIDYGVKSYRSEELGNRFSLLEYYSLTDIKPKDLSGIARKQNRLSNSVCFLNFDSSTYFASKELNMETKINNFHSIRGRVLTPEDKMNIMNKLKEENYPLLDGIYDVAARYYVELGIESISKENIRKAVITKYNKARGVANNTVVMLDESDSKILLKQF